MKTIAMVDFITAGHHLAYQKMYAHALIESGNQVLGIFPEPERVKRYLNNQMNREGTQYAGYVFRRQKEIQIPYWRLRHWLQPLLRWRRLQKIIKRAERTTGFKSDLVFLLYLDDYLIDASAVVPHIIPKVFRYSWSGLYFRPHHLRQGGLQRAGGPTDTIQRSYHCGVPRSEKEWLRYGAGQEVALKASNCVCVGTLDEGTADLLSRRLNKRVVCFPDCSLSDTDTVLSTQVRVSGKLPTGKKIVALLGDMHSRKGLIEFIQLSRLLSGDEGLFFVAAGRMDDRIRSGYSAEDLALIDEVIDSPPSNLQIVTREISDFDECVNRADVIFAAYRDFPFSSNILHKAAFYRKPVIVNDGYLMAERVRKYGTGAVVEQGNISAMAAAVTRLVSRKQGLDPGHPMDYEGYLNEHSYERLKQALEEVLALSHDRL